MLKRETTEIPYPRASAHQEPLNKSMVGIDYMHPEELDLTLQLARSFRPQLAKLDNPDRFIPSLKRMALILSDLQITPKDIEEYFHFSSTEDHPDSNILAGELTFPLLTVSLKASENKERPTTNSTLVSIEHKDIVSPTLGAGGTTKFDLAGYNTFDECEYWPTYSNYSHKVAYLRFLLSSRDSKNETL